MFIKIKNSKIFFLAIAVLICGAGSVFAAPLSKEDVEVIIEDYLKANPEVLLESLENYRLKQQSDLQAQTQKKIKDNLSKLTDGSAPEIGNKDGDVTVVEFFDYNCGYCKRALPDIRDLVEKDKNVRVIFKEMPILSPQSTTMARWALAAHKQGKYFAYHTALMEYRGPKTDERLKKLARELDMDVEQLEKDSKSSDIAAQLEKEQAIAREVGVRGTPAFIINGEFFPGYLGPDGLTDAIKKARESQKSEKG